MPKIVHISDTHTYHRQVVLPEGDILIHSGDITKMGTLSEIEDFVEWMSEQKFSHKICISGNHDWCFTNALRKKSLKLFKNKDIVYLQDSSIIIDNIKFWGSPWTPEYFNWAWNLSRGKALAAKWAQIPDDVNVLITHGPPYGVLDLVENNLSNIGRDLHQGCQDLFNRVMDLKQLKAHCFGHLHYGYGKIKINNITFSNAASCNERYIPDNPPITFDL